MVALLQKAEDYCPSPILVGSSDRADECTPAHSVALLPRLAGGSVRNSRPPLLNGTLMFMIGEEVLLNLTWS
jgi:hypothetical protein